MGKFLSLDPDYKKYPFMTPYCFAANNPIKLIDENGEGPRDPRTGQRKSWGLLNLVNSIRILQIYSEFHSSKDAADPDMKIVAMQGQIYSSAAAIKGASGDYFENWQYKILVEPYKDSRAEGADLTQIETAFSKSYAMEVAMNQEKAALSGNYKYMEEMSDDKFTVGNVWQGELTQLDEFEKNKDGKFDNTQRVTFSTTSFLRSRNVMNFVTGKEEKQIYKQITTTEYTKDLKTGKQTSKEYTYEEAVPK